MHLGDPTEAVRWPDIASMRVKHNNKYASGRSYRSSSLAWHCLNARKNNTKHASGRSYRSSSLAWHCLKACKNNEIAIFSNFQRPDLVYDLSCLWRSILHWLLLTPLMHFTAFGPFRQFLYEGYRSTSRGIALLRTRDQTWTELLHREQVYGS